MFDGVPMRSLRRTHKHGPTNIRPLTQFLRAERYIDHDTNKRKTHTRNSAEMASHHASGSTPLASAACCILSPCSSVPVRKTTGRAGFRMRWNRAMMSAVRSEWRWPMCGPGARRVSVNVSDWVRRTRAGGAHARWGRIWAW